MFCDTIIGRSPPTSGPWCFGSNLTAEDSAAAIPLEPIAIVAKRALARKFPYSRPVLSVPPALSILRDRRNRVIARVWLKSFFLARRREIGPCPAAY